MLQGSFTEEDVNKFVEFLNYVADRAVFKECTIKDQLAFVQLLGYQQKTILHKMRQSILEVVDYKEPAPKAKAKPATSTRKKTRSK